jgi:hypothetical protein
MHNSPPPCMQASQHGNTDAKERLTALSLPAPQALSRQEHDNLTETTLVRKRTQAKQRSDARGFMAGPRQGARPNGQQVVANIRKNSLAERSGPARSTHPYAYAINDGNANRDRRPSFGTSNTGSEAHPYQRSPQQIPLSMSSGSGGPSGYRPPAQPVTGTGQGGYAPPPPLSQPRRGSSPAPGAFPSPRMPAQPYGQTAGRPGPAPGAPGRRQQASSGFGPEPTPSLPISSDPPARLQQAKGPATFQEMGFQSQKLEEKDCVIM